MGILLWLILFWLFGIFFTFSICVFSNGLVYNREQNIVAIFDTSKNKKAVWEIISVFRIANLWLEAWSLKLVA